MDLENLSQDRFITRPVYYRAKGNINSQLSLAALKHKKLLQSYDLLLREGVSALKAAEALGVSKAWIYCLKRRFQEKGGKGLEPRSRRPIRVRHPQWRPQVAERVYQLRRDFPVYGKCKIKVLLEREGYAVSASTIGRILKKLIDRGAILSVPRLRCTHPKRKRRFQKHAKRKPYRLKATCPGELLQIDTLTIQWDTNLCFKQFTAACPVSGWTSVDVYRTASSATARDYLDKLIAELPFELKSIQVDGGSEFMKHFEDECQRRNIALYVLPPKSPKLNGCVERANGSYRYEFYWLQLDLPNTVEELRPLLKKFQQQFNTFRPHQGLDYLTPLQYLSKSAA